MVGTQVRHEEENEEVWVEQGGATRLGGGTGGVECGTMVPRSSVLHSGLHRRYKRRAMSILLAMSVSCRALRHGPAFCAQVGAQGPEAWLWYGVRRWPGTYTSSAPPRCRDKQRHAAAFCGVLSA